MKKASEIAMSMSAMDEEIAKEANEFEAKMAEDIEQKKPFKMSDYIKAQSVDEVNDEEKIAASTDIEDKKQDNKMLAGAGVSGSGAALAKHTYDRGNLTGRETLYHNTRKENVDSIKKNGLKGQFATDKNKAFTPDILGHLDESELKGKVYLGRKRSVAENVGLAAKKSDVKTGKGDFERKTLKAKVPTWKMKEVDNPELMGAKDGQDWVNKIVDAKKKKMVDEGTSQTIADMVFPENLKKNPIMKIQGNHAVKSLGRKGTAVIEGDLDAKYIKGHKGYKGAGLKEVGEFIKHNPKRFAKGVGQVGAGAALVGAGGKIVHDAYKQKQQNKIKKVANLILEEANMVKEAGIVQDVKDYGNHYKEKALIHMNKKPYMTEKTRVENGYEDGKIVIENKTNHHYKNGKIESVGNRYEGSEHAQLPSVIKNTADKADKIEVNDKKKFVEKLINGAKSKKGKVALGAAGTVAIGAGGVAIYNKHKKNKVEKIANVILEEAGFIK